ncbi:hypothetical protein Gotur_026320 [Gossypium turneri]
MHRLDRGHHACFGYESGCRLHYNAWNSWNNHNNFVFKGKEEDVRVVWDRAITLCQDFHIHNLVNKPLLPVTPATKNWGGGFKDVEMLAAWVELYAFEESLKFAISLNISKVIFESDCVSLVNKVKKRGKDITMLGYGLQAIGKF